MSASFPSYRAVLTVRASSVAGWTGRRCVYVCLGLALWLLTSADCAAQSTGNHTDTLIVAATQYPVEGNQSSISILNKCAAFITEATEQSARLIIFPELVTLDAWPVADPPKPPPEGDDRTIVRRIAEDVTPPFLAGMRALSEKHQIMILTGSSPCLSNGSLFNTSVLIFPDGRQLQQDKLNLTKWEAEVGFAPGTHLNVGSAPWGRTAILICYDVEFPDVSVQLMAQRPTLLLVPSMTESAAGLHRVRSCAQARAVEHHAFVIVSGTVGKTSPTWQHHGQAAVLTPHSSLFLAAGASGTLNQRDLVVSQLDFLKLRSGRAAADIYPSRDAAGRKAPILMKTTELQYHRVE